VETLSSVSLVLIVTCSSHPLRRRTPTPPPPSSFPAAALPARPHHLFPSGHDELCPLRRERRRCISAEVAGRRRSELSSSPPTCAAVFSCRRRLQSPSQPPLVPPQPPLVPTCPQIPSYLSSLFLLRLAQVGEAMATQKDAAVRIDDEAKP
jgi:hypothetical protein